MWDLSVGMYVSTHVSADECVRVHTRIGAAETMGGTRDRLWVGVASSGCCWLPVRCPAPTVLASWVSSLTLGGG